MSYILKIFDFHISSKRTASNTTYHALAMNHPGLINYINTEGDYSENIHRKLVFDSFLLKFSNDLNSENLKNVTTKKIIKKSKRYRGSSMVTIDILKDYNNKLLYGVLHAGRITNNAVLESPEEDDYKYALLNGDRIYDDFFFMLHISFRCNIARLFIVNGGNNTNVDALLKKYLRDSLFRAPDFHKTKNSDFIPPEYREAVLGRATVNNVLISKADTVISQNDGIEYEVEIRLKPKATNAFSRITQETISQLRKSKVILENSTADDENSELKFSIRDPVTNKSKTVSYGRQDEFIPRLVLADDQVFSGNNQINVAGLKAVCMEYINYEGNQLS